MIGKINEAKRLRMTNIRIANCKINNSLVSNRETKEQNLSITNPRFSKPQGLGKVCIINLGI